jgi:hypothetical protein
MKRPLLPAIAIACFASGFAAERSSAAELRLSLETPRDAQSVAEADGQAFIAGRALVVEPKAEQFDLVVVIDTSRSTAAPSGADVDGDGFLGSNAKGRRLDGTCDDWGDTVMAAQILATRTLLSQLDPGTTRVGIVTFSGDEDPRTPDAVRLAPMTRDYAHLGDVLDYLLGHRPRGKTNIAEAVQVASSELLGSEDARSRPRAGATRVVLLMTDGQPTLPSNRDEARIAVFDAARSAAEAGVRVDTFAIGHEANEDPSVPRALARQTGGVFTAVFSPSELVAHFEKMRLTRLARVDVRNRTAGKDAQHVVLEPDGEFAALVELVDGENIIEIAGRASDGSTARTTRIVHQVRGGRTPALSPRLAKWRTRVLENQLELVRTKRIDLETAQGEEVLEDLAREMEQARKERARAISVSVPPQPK